MSGILIALGGGLVLLGLVLLGLWLVMRGEDNFTDPHD
jgi:hypothetical protein